MHSRLVEILEEKKKEVEELKKSGIAFTGNRLSGTSRDFKGALAGRAKISLIAEIKFASPSAGTIREMSDPMLIGRIYEKAGASAISLLTDKKFFRGDLKNLPKLKEAVSLPVLRKDFIIDEIQIKESAFYGADAVLLIAGILDKEQLCQLLDTCRGFGLAALTEVHDREDLDKAVNCGADIIGINNRDLDTFSIDLKTTTQLVSLIPGGSVIVSESGIHSGEDVQALKGENVHAVLVGSAIMSSDNIEGKVKELVAAGK